MRKKSGWGEGMNFVRVVVKVPLIISFVNFTYFLVILTDLFFSSPEGWIVTFASYKYLNIIT